MKQFSVMFQHHGWRQEFSQQRVRQRRRRREGGVGATEKWRKMACTTPRWEINCRGERVRPVTNGIINCLRFLLSFCGAKSNFGVRSWQAIKRITSCSENRGLVSICIFHTTRQHNPGVTLRLSAEEVGAMVSWDQWAAHKYSKWVGNSSEASRSALKREPKAYAWFTPAWSR